MGETGRERSQPWSCSAWQLAEKLGVDTEAGLSAYAAAQRRGEHGPNRVAEAPPRSAWSLFFAQFTSLLVAVLAAAAILSAAVGDMKDAAVIAVVVVLNALVGFWQEYRAEQSLAAIKQMVPLEARVRREGRSLLLPAEEIVPGDVVLLEAGDRVPADGRLLSSHGLAVDESALTGESRPAEKDAMALVSPDASAGDRDNMVHMNTMVARGRAEMLVSTTGMDTEMGRISVELAKTPDVSTPLQRQLDRFGKRLGAIVLALIAALLAIELARGVDLTHVILDSIALAVAGVPEGLPVVVTVTLALGMHKMARQRAIVKRLPSVETLGCTTVICSDKTGTLTLNQMAVRAFFYQGQRFSVSNDPADGTIEPQALRPALDFGPLTAPLVACNDAELHEGRVIGDPMEGALLTFAAWAGANVRTMRADLPRVAEIPFDTAHKFMATAHATAKGPVLFIKGAPDVLLARCSHALAPNGVQPLDDAGRSAIEAEYRRLAAGGLRGLLIATRSLSARPSEQQDLHSLVDGLMFVALIGLMDPPRPEAKTAIERCSAAGIAVKMITGDHPDTAKAIARELGLEGGLLTGKELESLDAAPLAQRADATAVFARVTPHQKVKIVRALKMRGHVVAMTGDGVNDAPALKHADIGIAMGITGTAVSKEAASMILTDDNFATIVRAVREGRVLYDNILKFIRFQLSTTIGAIVTVALAPFFGLPEPFTPIQILWVALIMDGPPAVSLALDAGRPGIMNEPPRSAEQPLLTWQRLARILGFGGTMAAGTLGVMVWTLEQGYDESRAATLAFTTFVLFQLFNVFNARVGERTAFNDRFFRNRLLWVSLTGVLLLQIVAVHWGVAQEVFGTASMSVSDWLLATAVASSVLLLEEGRKLVLRSFGGNARGCRKSA